MRAAGLNFRDVLNVLGMYPGDAGPLGSECAGTVTAVGDGVDGLVAGRGRHGAGRQQLRHLHDRRRPISWCAKPARLSFEEAATIPIAFLTADYGLHAAGADLAPGERVLIHAAAGGVGLAAVQLAQRRAPRSSPPPAAPRSARTCASLGVQHVMDSRSLDFAEEIRALTSGHGVDVVLNSLTGEFIARSVDVAAPPTGASSRSASATSGMRPG